MPLLINYQKNGFVELYVENQRREWATTLSDKKLKFDGVYFVTLGNSFNFIET